MSDTLYGSVEAFEGHDGVSDPAAGLSQQAAMAGMLIGPVISDEGMRDGIRDAAAAALRDAGVEAIILHLSDRRRMTLTPTEIVEVFLSRLGGEFGFTIPGYLTLNDAPEGITSNSAA